MAERTSRSSGQMKVVAIRLYDTSGRLFFAEDDDDYEEMRKFPGGTFGCPECGLPFNKPSRPRGRRYHFVFKRDVIPCNHLPARTEHGGGGGPMSEEHKWLQNRLLTVCRVVGHEAIPEHRPTDSDLFVPSANYAIEVQRWNTDWEKRTRARKAKGARVVWAITDSMGSEKSRKDALFGLPCVRLRVHARGDGDHQPLQPWDDKEDNARAVISVWATVAKWDEAKERFVTGFLDGAKFFGQVLDGKRSWHPRGTAELGGLDRGVWTLESDMAKAREAAKARAAREEAEGLRKAEEQRKAEELRKLEAECQAEELRILEDERQAEQLRKAEEEREAEKQRKLEEQRQAAIVEEPPMTEDPSYVEQERFEQESQEAADHLLAAKRTEDARRAREQAEGRGLKQEDWQKLLNLAGYILWAFLALCAVACLLAILVKCSTGHSYPQPERGITHVRTHERPARY